MLTVGIYGVADKKNPNGQFSFISHDHGLAFSRGNKIIDTIELERYTGIKHDNRMEKYVIEILLKIWDKKEKLRFVLVNSFLGDSFLSTDETLAIHGAKDFQLSKIYTRTTGYFTYGGYLVDSEFYVMSHEFAHVAAVLPFCGDFNEESLLFHIDGGASISCRSIWSYNRKKLSLLDYGWDITKDAVNNFNDNPLAAWVLGESLDDHLAIPGKLMGLAAWGKKNVLLYDWLRENTWFLDFAGTKGAFIALIPVYLNYGDIEFSTTNRFCQDVAYCFQQYFEDEVVNYIVSNVIRNASKNVYYSGGAALNIIANTKLEKALKNVSLFIPPPASDCGLALGAAAFFSWKDFGGIEKGSPFINSIYKNEHTFAFCSRNLSEYVVQGRIVGIIFGDGEIGPRALGHRSLIARADSIELRKHLSETIKKREWYRPVSPIILRENAEKMLQDYNPKSNLGTYMLGCWEVKSEYRDLFRGVIHADNTVRAQIIDKDTLDLDFLYILLKDLWEQHGIVGVINTSLNIQGRPMIHLLDNTYYEELCSLGVTLLSITKK